MIRLALICLFGGLEKISKNLPQMVVNYGDLPYYCIESNKHHLKNKHKVVGSDSSWLFFHHPIEYDINPRRKLDHV